MWRFRSPPFKFATAVLALATAVLVLLPALGKAIGHFKRKRPNR